MKYYKQSAEKGNDIALNNMGDFYYYGKGVQQSYSKAKEYYLKSADKGNALALCNKDFPYSLNAISFPLSADFK